MRFFGKPSKVNSMPYIQIVSQQTALTQFLKEVGNSVGIVYTDPNGSSGAYMDGTLSSYRSYGYTANAVYHNLATVKQWLMNEKKPIHMTGYLYGGPGHAWICDGMLQYGDSMSFFSNTLVREIPPITVHIQVILPTIQDLSRVLILEMCISEWFGDGMMIMADGTSRIM